jgi:hypothetical protein
MKFTDMSRFDCNFAADLLRFEAEQAESDQLEQSIAEAARDDFVSGDCSPQSADNIKEALENLAHLPCFNFQTLADASRIGDAAEFGRLLLAAIETYWLNESVRIARIEFDRSH